METSRALTTVPPTPEIRFQLSLLRMLSPDQRLTPQIEQVQQLLSQALSNR